MPDYSFIAQQPQSNAIQNISGIMGIAGQAQQLQSGQMGIEQAQLNLSQRKALIPFMQNIKQFRKSDGSWDVSGAMDSAYRVAPDLAADAMTKLFGTVGQAAAAHQAITALNETNRAAIGKVVQSVARQPYPVQEQAINAVVQGNPGLKPWGDIVLGQLRQSENDPKAREDAANRIAASTIGVPEQVELKTPSGPVLSTGQTTQMYNIRPTAGEAGPVAGTTAQQVVPPTGVETIEQDALGNRHVVSRSPQGTILSTRPVPAGGGQPNAPNAPGFTNLPAGDREAIPQRTTQRIAVNNAAAQAPTQHSNNRYIISLAPEAYTGTYSEAWAKIMGAVGLQNTPGDRAANSQRLGHFMALQAQANSQAMNAGTDAARMISERATGSQEWTRDAIISTAKVNDALTSGVELFNRGMEKAIANAGGNVLAVGAFQNAWTQHFDVRAMQLHNALQAMKEVPKGSDAYKEAEKDVKEIVTSVAGKGSKGAEGLFKKYEMMHRLSTQGGL